MILLRNRSQAAHSTRTSALPAASTAPRVPRLARARFTVVASSSSGNAGASEGVNEMGIRQGSGSVFGSAMLVAGTTVGAGILAVPAVTEPAGFVASSVSLAGCCAYSIITGLLIAEVAINTISQEQAKGGDASNVSLLTMASKTLGEGSRPAVSALYCFQHYCLLVAYIARAGGIVASTFSLPQAAGAAAFAFGVGGMCGLLPGRLLDGVNNVLVGGVVASFLALVALLLPGVDWRLLAKANWGEVPHSLPVIALAFVYQNVVPVVVKDLGLDVKKVRSAIVLGSLLPLAMFWLWEMAVLGNMQPGAGAVTDPLVALEASNAAAKPLVEAFSFLAIATSYIGFCLGLTDFLVDALGLGRSSAGSTAGKAAEGAGHQQQPQQEGEVLRSRVVPYALTILPPLALSLTSPDIFYAALDIAGTYGVMTLFGLIPAAMAWQQRYGGAQAAAAVGASPASQPASPASGLAEPLLQDSSSQRQPGAGLGARIEAVPGGKGLIGAVAAIAIAIVGNELALKFLG